MFRERFVRFRRFASLFAAGCLILVLANHIFATSNSTDPRLGKSYRFERGGWIYVHLEGPPSQPDSTSYRSYVSETRLQSSTRLANHLTR